MIELLKKHKYKIITTICIVAVLAVAFLLGDNIGENSPVTQNYTIAETSEKEQNTTLSLNTTETKSRSNTVATSKAVQVTTAVQGTTNSSVEQTTAFSQPVTVATEKPTSQNKKPATTSQDKYKDPIPEDRPQPVEPQEQETVDNTLKCTFSISCATVLDNMDKLHKSKKEIIPDDGWILKPVAVKFNEGESVFDVLKQVCRDNKIQLESSFTPVYNSAYIEGIYNLYEFDCGSLSGWTYEVNGWFPSYGCSRYEVKNGDVIEWHFTCNNGFDIGKYDSLGE